MVESAAPAGVNYEVEHEHGREPELVYMDKPAGEGAGPWVLGSGSWLWVLGSGSGTCILVLALGFGLDFCVSGSGSGFWGSGSRTTVIPIPSVG
jgi:hypothetical protein